MQPKMTILIYKDNHFNLIIDKNSMLAFSSSFSFQREMALKGGEEPKVIKYDSPNDTLSDLTLKKKIEELEITLNKVLCENKRLRTGNPTKSEQNHSGQDQETLECDDCGKRLKYNARLENHILKVQFVFFYNCNVCGKGFAQKSSLCLYVYFQFDHFPKSKVDF